MDIAVHVRENTYDRYRAAAQWAEANGLAAVAIPDHYWYRPGPDGEPVPAHDALTVAAGLAADTDTIEIVLLVSPVTFRHPAVLAKAAATIDEISGGRLVLGVGTGWSEDEHELFGIGFPPMSDRYEELEEHLGYLRAAADPTGPGFTGLRHRLEPGPVLPSGPRRLLVGGTGTRKTPTLAGRFADEFNAYPAAPDDYRAKLDVAAAAARDLGRDPAGIRISTSTVLVGGHDNSAYTERLGLFASRMGIEIDQADASLRERNAPTGTWDEWRQTLDEYSDLGVERIYLQLVGGFDAQTLAEAVSALR